jgi:membrane protein implicated in regulation of membrane protease activity
MNNETLFDITVALSAAGVLVFALAPLALPILILTIVATVPLLLAGLAVALVVGVIVASFVIVRRLLQRAYHEARGTRERERFVDRRIVDAGS